VGTGDDAWSVKSYDPEKEHQSEEDRGQAGENVDGDGYSRGDEGGAYKNIIGVLNICTEAGVTNVAFATAK